MAAAVESAADGLAALSVSEHKAAAAAHAPFYARRIELFEKFHARQQAGVEAARAAAVPIKIVLPDGSVKEGIKGVTTPLDVAAGISKSLAKKVVVAKVDGARVWDAFRPLEADCALQLLSFDDADGRETFWHSSAHVLGEALELEFGVDLTIGPALEEGFYYDCYMGDRVRFLVFFLLVGGERDAGGGAFSVCGAAPPHHHLTPSLLPGYAHADNHRQHHPLLHATPPPT